MKGIAYRIALGAVGVAALPVGFAALGFGVFMAFGSPIPTSMPSAQQVWAGLTQAAMTEADKRRLLAIAFWLVLAYLLRLAVVEVTATLRGRAARRVRFAGPIQPLMAQLVAWCAIALMPMTPRPVSSHAQSPPALAVALAGTGASVPSTTDVATASSPAPGDPVWIVQPGDNASLIADRTMHDQRKWPLLWRLDRGIREPDGRRWTDPNLMFPHWRLPLPPGAEVPGESGAATPSNGSHPAAPSTPSPGGGAATSSGVPASELPEPAKPPIDRPPFSNTALPSSPAPLHHRHADGECPPAVTLPSGGVVPLVLASALAGAVALARLQRRRQYRPREPRARFGPPPAEPFMTATVARLLRHLSAARRDATQDSEGEPTTAAWVIPGDDRRPGEVVLGHRLNEPVVVDLLAHPGIALRGTGAVAVARAVALQVLAEGQRGRAEVIAVGPAAAGALSGAEDVPNASTEPSAEDGLTHVEIELMGRRRAMEETGAADFRDFIASQQYEPMPLLLVVASAGIEQERLAALLASGARLGIAGVALCDDAAWPGGVLTIGARGELNASEGRLGADLAGSKLVSLSEDEARDCLSVIAMSTGSRPIPEPVEPVADGAYRAPTEPQESGGTTDSDEAPVALAGKPYAEERSATSVPVRAALFGAYGIAVCGKEVRTGLRRSARELLAYLVLHAEGARPEAAIADIWPDLDEQRGAEQFRTAIRNLRQVFRGLTGLPLPMFIEHRAERYAIDRELIGADALDVEAALRAYERAEDDATREATLGQILDSYAGELLDGYQRSWLEPYREELRQRVLQAALRLADLRATTVSDEAALPILERATRINPYAEEVYRTLMATQARAGHSDMVATTLRSLERRLAELDAEPEDATVQLAARLSRAEKFA